MNTKNNENTPAEDICGRVTMASMLEVIREGLEISKVEMANKLGITRQHYNNIVNESSSVSISRAIKFARILNDSEKVFITVAIEDELARVEQPGFRVELIEENQEMRA